MDAERRASRSFPTAHARQVANSGSEALASVRKHPLRSLGVIGAGRMGQSIAVEACLHGLPVVMTDKYEETLVDALRSVNDRLYVQGRVRAPHFLRFSRPDALIRGVVSHSDLGRSDVVLETVTEDPQIKQQVLADVERHLGDHTLLLTNTSTIPISTLSRSLQRVNRFCGLHFCCPIAERRLIEVIPAAGTSQATINQVLAFVRSIGRFPLKVHDGPGFVVNRLLLPYLTEAAVLLAGGIEFEAIERAAKGFGMPMGPLEQMDELGLDFVLHAGAILHQSYADRVPQPAILTRMNALRLLGCKTGRGFYVYSDSGRIAPNPGLAALIKAESLRSDESTMSPEDVTCRLFLPMLLEATRLLEEGVIQKASDIDRALMHGLGFDGPHSGLLAWCDAVGIDMVFNSLKRFMNIGARYQPTTMLLNSVQTGRKFCQ